MPDTGAVSAQQPIEINLLLRGQSNMAGLAVLNRWVGSKTLAEDVGRLLGFVSGRDKVNIIFDHAASDGSTTVIGGTAFLRDWIEPIGGDWRNGWQLDTGSRQLLTAVEQTIARNTFPTAVVWLHNESDSYLPGGKGAPTAEQWIDGVRWEAALVRAAANRTAAEMPYVLVSAIPYIANPGANQTIRVAMEMLSEDADFNAVIGARSTDLDQNNDNPAQFGGPHNSWTDGVLLAKRLALIIAEQFAHLARPGSPVALAGGNIPSEGPKVISAMIVSGQPNSLVVRVEHDVATGLLPLSAVAAAGAAWSARPSTGAAIAATSVEILDSDLLKITFAKPLSVDMNLFFGWGNARSAIGNAPGQGNAIYDTAGLPVWTDPRGVPITLDSLPAPNSAPTDIILEGAGHFKESAAAGLVIATLKAIDRDPNDSVTLRLLDDAGGRVLLDPTTGVLSIATGARFDALAERQITISAQARDAGGLTYEESFTFLIDQVPKAPPGMPAQVIVTNASAIGRGDGISFTVPLTEPAAGETILTTWTNALMGLKWTAATAAIQVALADGAIEARVTSGWSSLKGLWLSDDASSITVAGAGNVMVTALSGTGAAITVEAVKSGTVRGGSGDDMVVFSAYSDAPNRPTASGVYDNLVSIFGGDGNDTIVCQDWNGWTAFVVDGGNGNDVILGGDGNDTLRGNHGRDLITGGTGADRFVMRPGNGRSGDVITDFDPGQGDRLVFEAVNPATVRWSLSPDGVVVTYDRADWLLLQGVLALAPDAILFV